MTDKIEEKDELYADVCKFTETHGHVTPSMLQRNFRVGYGRAITLIEQMDRGGKIKRIEIEKFNSFKWQWIEEKAETPLRRAYNMLSNLMVVFPNCPFCGRGMPGHHVPDCDYLKLWDSLQAEKVLIP
jgi:DNA segregation ATPase FtsK/SpoIIIE-like protein